MNFYLTIPGDYQKRLKRKSEHTKILKNDEIDDDCTELKLNIMNSQKNLLVRRK